MGDPETEVVLPRIKSDLVELFQTVALEKLDTFKVELDSRTAATVMIVAGGYQKNMKKARLLTEQKTYMILLCFMLEQPLIMDK